MTTDQMLALLAARVEDLAAKVATLQGQASQHELTWLEPGAMAVLLGVSTRSLGHWRTNGRIKPDSYRPKGRGFQYHRQKTFADLGQETN